MRRCFYQSLLSFTDDQNILKHSTYKNFLMEAFHLAWFYWFFKYTYTGFVNKAYMALTFSFL